MSRDKTKITISDYNGLYARVEVGFGDLLRDFKFDCLEKNSQQQIYNIYKKNANNIVDNILNDLNIELDRKPK